MPATQCPQCAGTVQAGVDEFCASCGYPLFWEPADDRAEREDDPTPSEMARLPGEAAPRDSAPAHHDTDEIPSEIPAVPEPRQMPPPAGSLPDAVPPPTLGPAEGPAPAAAVSAQHQVRCPGCGHANPEARVLCQRCGVELRTQAPDPPPPQVQPAPPRSRWLVAALVAVLVLGAVATAWWLWPDSTEPEPPQPVLQIGSTGEDVRIWQEQLDRAGFPVVVDGVFGPATEQATKDFQDEAGLHADGVVDAATREAMSRQLD